MAPIPYASSLKSMTYRSRPKDFRPAQARRSLNSRDFTEGNKRRKKYTSQCYRAPMRQSRAQCSWYLKHWRKQSGCIRRVHSEWCFRKIKLILYRRPESTHKFRSCNSARTDKAWPASWCRQPRRSGSWWRNLWRDFSLMSTLLRTTLIYTSSAACGLYKPSKLLSNKTVTPHLKRAAIGWALLICSKHPANKTCFCNQIEI